MKILVLGAAGMLGHAMMRVLGQNLQHEVTGSVRSASARKHFTPEQANNIITGIDVENTDALIHLFSRVQPDLVINCIGLIKQLAEADDPLSALPINALLPHRLSRLCALTDARLVHFSTDCVFSGRKGNYLETDEPDAQDLYGRSKLLGEVEYPHTVTLRTSIIGHELASSNGLIEWFLGQKGNIRGFTRAIFSGLPTCELARVIIEYVIPNSDLCGLYHVSGDPISKFDLLRLVSSVYCHPADITPSNSPVIDRSLDSSRFRNATGYLPPSWPALIEHMRAFG